MKKKTPIIKITTPEFRVSFPNVYEPKAFKPGAEAKYSITMLFDKSTDISELKKAAQDAIQNEYGKDRPKKPFRTPFRDGNEKEYDGYADKIFITSSSKMKPGLVDKKCKPIIDSSEFYPGCYARAVVTCFAYDSGEKWGVGFGLNHIQKTRDGEPFSGRGRAEDAFDPFNDGGNSSNDDLMGDSSGYASDDIDL